MDVLKNQAEFYRQGAMHGLIPVPEVIAWADSLIAASDSPPAVLLDISLLRPTDLPQLVRILGEVPGIVDKRHVSQQLFSRMATVLEEDEVLLPRVTRMLEHMAGEDLAPTREARGNMWGFDDLRWLAENESYGTVAQVRSEVLAFLQRYSLSDAA
jgi:hypothetical protein